MAAVNQIARPASPDSDTRNNRAETAGTICEQPDRNIRGIEAQVIPFPKAPIFDLGNYTLIDRIGDAIDADTADCRSPVKKIASAIAVNLRTAENYKQRKNAPNLEQALKLAASPEFPAVRALFIELLALEETRNPLAEQKFNEFVRAWLKKG